MLLKNKKEKKKEPDDASSGYYSFSSPNFTWKSCLGGYFLGAFNTSYFLGAFNTSYLHQIWQNLHANDHLTFLYNPIWSAQDDWHHNSRDVGLKWLTAAPFNRHIWQFMVLTLNQQLGSFPVEPRAKIWHH